MTSGHNQAHMKEMEAQGWKYKGDGRFQHEHGKEVYVAVVALLRMREGHLDNVVFYAHDIRDDEPVTEVIAENVYGKRYFIGGKVPMYSRCLSCDANLNLIQG